MIKQMKYPGYFLIVWDFIRYAREQGIPVGPGRGSAAGSLVAYCLRITDVDPIDYYLGVLADKTGALVATAARYGAMFGGGSPEMVEVLRVYGERLGMAFQLADDIIDIASDGAMSGKTPGTDLREGVDTLAVLFAKASADPADARLQELLAADLTDDVLHAEALALLRANPALERARAHTREVGAQAREALAGLPDSDAKAALVALVDQVVERVG